MVKSALESDIRETLRTDDGQLIYMTALGIFHAAPETFQRLSRGDPATAAFETGTGKYGWLNQITAVGTCERTPTGVIHTVYAIL